MRMTIGKVGKAEKGFAFWADGGGLPHRMTYEYKNKQTAEDARKKYIEKNPTAKVL